MSVGRNAIGEAAQVATGFLPVAHLALSLRLEKSMRSYNQISHQIQSLQTARLML
jgi:hypothetical protein